MAMPSLPKRPCRHPGCAALVESGWCEQHKRPSPGKFADPERGSRHERGYGSAWDRRRVRILERDRGLCQECLRQGRVTPVGATKFSAFVDHIKPKAEGGTDDDNNLQTLCRTCHQVKTQREANRGR